jgi:hypothetical protein
MEACKSPVILYNGNNIVPTIESLSNTGNTNAIMTQK